MPRRILITGAEGFVGRHLVRAIDAALPEAQIFASSFDVTDPDAVRNLVADTRPDACVHLAAIAAVPAASGDPHAAWRVNLHGTLNLAAALRGEAPNCMLMYVSSAEVYGASFRVGEALSESAVLAPANVYAATKAAADLALGAMAEQGFPVIRVRPFNHAGPGQSEAFVVAAFARQIARIEAGLQEPVLSVGNLAARRDFLDVRDVCDAYVEMLRRGPSLPNGTILNLASGTPRAVSEVLQGLLALSPAKVEIVADPARMRPSDTPLAQGDSSRARRLLGWTPRVVWETTLADVLADWRARVSPRA